MKSISEIKEKVNYSRKTISKIKDLEKLSLEPSINEQDRYIIEQEITKLKSTLKNVNKIKETELMNMLKKYDLDTTLLEDLRVEYLIDKCIVRGEITMIVAPPGQGKSSFALATAIFCLQSKLLDNIIYLDLDNSMVTLADRKLHRLKNKFQEKFKYLHGSSVTKTEMLHVLQMLAKSSLNSYLIVLDSAKNFMMNGKDRDSNKDVSEFMNIVKTIRDNGATVIILHHVNKPQKDMDTVFAGAAAWMEDVSGSFMLKQNRYKNCFILKPLKERVGSLFEVAFLFDKPENLIEECNLFYAKETEEDEKIRILIYKYIKLNKIKQTYSQILEYCTKNCGFSKNKVNAVIQAAKNQYWLAIKEQQNNNRDVFILLDKQDKLDK